MHHFPACALGQIGRQTLSRQLSLTSSELCQHLTRVFLSALDILTVAYLEGGTGRWERCKEGEPGLKEAKEEGG